MKKLFALVLVFILLASSAFAAEGPSEVDQFFTKYRLWMIVIGTDPGEYEPYTEQFNDVQTHTCWDAVSVLSNTKTGEVTMTDLAILINRKIESDDSHRIAAWLAASLCPMPTADYNELTGNLNNIVKPVYQDLLSAVFDGTGGDKEAVPFHQSEAGFMTAYFTLQHTRDMLYLSNIPLAGSLFAPKK